MGKIQLQLATVRRLERVGRADPDRLHRLAVVVEVGMAIGRGRDEEPGVVAPVHPLRRDPVQKTSMQPTSSPRVLSDSTARPERQRPVVEQTEQLSRGFGRVRSSPVAADRPPGPPLPRTSPARPRPRTRARPRPGPGARWRPHRHDPDISDSRRTIARVHGPAGKDVPRRRPSRR